MFGSHQRCKQHDQGMKDRIPCNGTSEAVLQKYFSLFIHDYFKMHLLCCAKEKKSALQSLEGAFL
jgi:hypothetical protein